MISTVSAEVLVDHAVQSLAGRWHLTPERASATLARTAATLGLSIGDLAALVSADAQREQALAAGAAEAVCRAVDDLPRPRSGPDDVPGVAEVVPLRARAQGARHG